MSILDTNEFTTEYTAEEIEQNKVVCILAYFGILFFLPLVACPDSKYGKFHANQGLLVLLMELVVSVVSGLFSALGIIPVIGLLFVALAGIIGGILGLCTTVLAILGIINAAQGKAKELPIIGKFRIIK